MHSDDRIDPFSYFIIMENLYTKLGDNIDLDVFCGGLAIEPLRESMKKLSYGYRVDIYC